MSSADIMVKIRQLEKDKEICEKIISKLNSLSNNIEPSINKMGFVNNKISNGLIVSGVPADNGKTSEIILSMEKCNTTQEDAKLSALANIKLLEERISLLWNDYNNAVAIERKRYQEWLEKQRETK